MSEQAKEKFSQWCFVELMGRTTLVGKCTEENIGGTNLLRIDIPKGEGFFTRYVGGSAIFSLTVIDEKTALKLCERCRDAKPPFAWELHQPSHSLLPQTGADPDDDPEFG
jgi:hypothetical protein